MTEKSEKPGDPFAQMMHFYEEWAKTWAGSMSEMVSSKGFADAMSQQVEASLGTMGLMRKQMAEMMEQTLQQMNLPSRKEVIGISERLTQMEMRLDDLQAKMDEVLDRLKS